MRKEEEKNLDRPILVKFSAELEKHRQESGVSQTRLADAINVDRATVCRIFNGDRAASQWKNISKICRELCLSSSEVQRLRSLYELEYYSEEIQHQHNCFAQMLSKLESVSYINSHGFQLPTFELPQVSCTRVYHGAAVVFPLIRALVMSQAGKDAETIVRISSRAPLTSDIMQNLVMQIEKSSQKLIIRHMLALESRSAKSTLQNFEAICNVAPVLLSSACKYSLHYYYCSDGASMHTPFAAYIVTDDHVLLISESFDEAVMIVEPDVVASYQSSFDRALAKTRMVRTTSLDTMERSRDMFAEVEYGFTSKTTLLMSVPMLSLLMDKEVLRQRIVPGEGNETLFEKIFDVIQNMARDTVPVQYITLEGLDLFVDKGICCAPLNYVYSVFSPAERLNVLERLRDIIENDSCIRILRPDRLYIPKSCCIEHIAGTGLRIKISGNGDKVLRMLTLDEASVVKSADEFIQHLAESLLTYDQQEALELISLRIEELKERIEF